MTLSISANVLSLAFGIFFAPESPRWLMKKGRNAEAFAAFNRLRLHPVIAARDLYYSHVLYEEERAQARGASYLSRLADCFRIPRIRRANLAASTVMLAQQMCGINSEWFRINMAHHNHLLLLLDRVHYGRILCLAGAVCVARVRRHQFPLRDPGGIHHRHVWASGAPAVCESGA